MSASALSSLSPNASNASFARPLSATLSLSVSVNGAATEFTGILPPIAISLPTTERFHDNSNIGTQNVNTTNLNISKSTKCGWWNWSSTTSQVHLNCFSNSLRNVAFHMCLCLFCLRTGRRTGDLLNAFCSALAFFTVFSRQLPESPWAVVFFQLHRRCCCGRFRCRRRCE